MAGEGADEAALKTALARDENGRAVDVKAFRSAILNNRKRRSLAEAEPVRESNIVFMILLRMEFLEIGC